MKSLAQAYGSRVLHGPFAGLRYTPEILFSRHSAPKLLGCYEEELHAVFEKAIADSSQYERFIDVGCAEGYYAVGYALKTHRPVLAFDAEPRELNRCRSLAQLNDESERVETAAWCDSDLLNGLTGKRCFVLADCEGYDHTLFVARALTGLGRCDVLIEVHGDDTAASAALLGRRFEATHTVEVLTQRARNPDHYSELCILGENEKNKAVSEYRAVPQCWLMLYSRQHNKLTA